MHEGKKTRMSKKKKYQYEKREGIMRLCNVKNPTQCPTVCIPLSDEKKVALHSVIDDSKDGYCASQMLKSNAFQTDTLLSNGAIGRVVDKYVQTTKPDVYISGGKTDITIINKNASFV